MFTQGFTTGIGRSTYELVNAISKLEDIPFDLVIYSQNIKGVGVYNLNSDLKKLHIFIPRRNPFNQIVNFLRLKYWLSRYDYLHIPHNTDKWENIGKTIYTIHDLIVYRYPEMWGMTDKDRMEHKYIADNCKAIVTCSESSKNDIIKFWNCPNDKVKVIPWGVNRDIFYPDYSPIDNINALSEKFYFCASCNHPRKQTKLILEAYRDYSEKGGDHQLVLLSPEMNELVGFEELIESKKVIIVCNVDDRTLIKLYSQAKATIIVSLYEGFGLPVLESLACHTQVISARNSSLPEAGGDIIYYLDNADMKHLSDSFVYFQKLSKSATLNIEEVEKHLSNFTWEKCALSYVSFWNSLFK